MYLKVTYEKADDKMNTQSDTDNDLNSMGSSKYTCLELKGFWILNLLTTDDNISDKMHYIHKLYALKS